MRSSLKHLTAVAGITCALAGAGPVAVAAADTTGPTNTTSGTPLLPGGSCSVNQGLMPGIPNLGPTGPLGPLGPAGPKGSGSGSGNLPCGGSAFNLGPSGPLGPGGLLGSTPATPQQGSPAQPPTSPAQPASPVKRTVAKHKTPGHGKAGHTHKHGHGKKHAVRHLTRR
jgi:hypothetical protein